MDADDMPDKQVERTARTVPVLLDNRLLALNDLVDLRGARILSRRYPQFLDASVGLNHHSTH